MKKVKCLIAVLVCAIIMMGVGYAWWNDSITLAGTAKTGNMKVELANWKVVAKTPDLNGVKEPANGEVKITNGNKKLTVTLSNLYPGAVFNLTGDIKSNGTVPAKYTGIDNIAWGGSAELKDQIQAAWGNGNALPTEYMSIDTFLGEVNGVDTVNKVVPKKGTETIIYLRVNPEAGNSIQNQTATVSFNLNFKQFNYSSVSTPTLTSLLQSK